MTNDEKQRDFQDLLAVNRGRPWGIARSFSDTSDTDDLYQEILLQLWKSIDSFAGDSSRETWVYRVALNTALTHRRQTSRRQKNLPVTTVDPAIIQQRHEQSREEQILDEFLHGLSPVDRALMLLFLDDLTHSEMAMVMGMNENQVSVRLHRIPQKFNQQYLESEP